MGVPETRLALVTAHRESALRRAYYLLGATGAAIAFAIQQTQNAPLRWHHVVWGIAVLSWAVSLLCGMDYIDAVQKVMSANADYWHVLDGTHPLAGRHPEAMQIGMEATMEQANKHADAAGSYFVWQSRLLVFGSLVFVLWHLMAMYLRARPVL